MKKAVSLHPLEIRKNMGTSYNFTGMKVAFCTAPDSNNQIKLVGYFDTCRETITDFLRTQLLGKGRSIKKATKISLKKIRLILFIKANRSNSKKVINNFGKRKDEEMLISLKLINHYERRLNWPRTKMQKLDNCGTFFNSDGEDVSNTINMYMIVGSSRWMKSPHLLSLYILLLRLGLRRFKAEFKTHAQLLDELQSFGGKQLNSCSFIARSDVSYVNQTYDKWDVLLENYDKLFGRRTIESLYSDKYLVNGSSGATEGIYSLCTGNSYDLDISHRFIKMCESKNIKIIPKVKDRRSKS